jgi:transcriptional regulator PpsR
MQQASLNHFKAPKRSLGDLDAEVAATLIAAAADIALIVDDHGVITDLALGNDELSQEGCGEWLGQPWISTVTVESRPKVEAMLRDAAAKVTPKWRQINHTSSRGRDLPILYSTIPVGSNNDRVVAVGRDLRAVASLQQRLVGAQQSMDKEYARLRHLETRYRLLFQMTSEAVLIVDASSQKIVEANPAARSLLGATSPMPHGSLIEVFATGSKETVLGLLATVRVAGRAEETRARLDAGKRDVIINMSLYRQENSSFFLVRISPLHRETEASVLPYTNSKVLDVIGSLPDGFIVTDPQGSILTCNRAFLDLAQLATEEQARGQSLERWLGRPGMDFNVLIANLRQHGSVRLFATVVRGEYGAAADVEISAVSVSGGEQPCIGLTVRHVVTKSNADNQARREIPRSVEQLTELVGRVPLRDLVRESTDLIERMCIEAALELTQDNRASAAEMLGLSRQSLYVKLRRYGLGDLAPENEA